MWWVLELIELFYFDSCFNFVGGEDVLLFECIEDVVKNVIYV